MLSEVHNGDWRIEALETKCAYCKKPALYELRCYMLGVFLIRKRNLCEEHKIEFLIKRKVL